MVFGTGYQNTYRPEPVTKRFLYRSKEVNLHIKTIALVSDVNFTKAAPDPHRAVVLQGKCDNDNNEGGKGRHENAGVCLRDTNGKPFWNFFNKHGPTDIAVIYHYGYKSFKEYIQKRERGCATMDREKGNVNGLIQDARRRAERAFGSMEFSPSNTNCSIAVDTDNLCKTNQHQISSEVYDSTGWEMMKKYVPRYAAMYD